jgi:putative lipoic acid-binding regulatory protein
MSESIEPLSEPASAAPTLLHFPCSYPIKAAGRADGDFAALVVAIVRRHAPDVDAAAVSLRESSGGKWLAVTVTIQAESRTQLDAIYQDLTADERVIWAL